eukprot:5470590-Amphidinium_carterae.1
MSASSLAGDNMRYIVARWLLNSGDCALRLAMRVPPGPTWVHSPASSWAASGLTWTSAVLSWLKVSGTGLP